ncbi:MAG: helix-turn-helix domain-containing protein [Acidimicrobiales bacterium]
MTNARALRQTSSEVNPRTYTVEQVARILGISRSTAYECVRLGTLPCLRFRRRIVIPASAIERLLEGAGPIVDETIGST